jgi:uncharacterized protein (TIGR02466 family)
MLQQNKNKIYRQDWWATPIWFFDINEKIDFKKIEQECLIEKNNDKVGRFKSNKNGWQSDLIVFNKYKEIENLLFYITNNVKSVIKDFGLKKNYKLFVNEYWININNKNGFNKSHIHPGSLFSSVIYIKVPKNSGKIVFERNPLETFILEQYCDEKNPFISPNISYEPIDKRVLIFPSYLSHYVEKNETDEDRISIAINFMVEKNE